MNETELRTGDSKRIPALIVSAALFALAVFLWFKWVRDLWPPDTSHQTGGMGAFLIYLWCRGLFNLLVLAAPLGATVAGLFLARLSSSSPVKAIKGIGTLLMAVNGGYAGILLVSLVYNIVAGFSFG